MLITILATIIVLGVLIFVHELGHFVTAKLVDIEVPRFSIGLGPKLVGFRRGETEYVISWLPLGGYVKMAGMEEMEVIEGKDERKTVAADIVDAGIADATVAPARGPRDFESKSVGARALVISAGVIMNFIFAFLVFAAAALVWGVQTSPEARLGPVVASDLPPGAQALASVPAGTRIVGIGRESVEDWADVARALLTLPPGSTEVRFAGTPPVTVELPAGDKERSKLANALSPAQEPVVGEVLEESPARQAGIRPGDRVVSAGGEPVRFWQDFVHVVQTHAGQPLPLGIQRGGQRLAITATPRAESDTLADGSVRTVGRLGVMAPLPPKVRPGIGGAIVHGAQETWGYATLVVDFLRDLVLGRQSPRNLGGPILIGQLSGRVARAGLEAFLRFMALFSVNLAVLNLLPIPVLDGGHLMFLAVEAVRGRALTVQQRARLTQVGFVLVVALMVWAVANDVLRLFGI
ncbi:MAG TPA: RIP metalloprotease RseP [Longimicrobiales bacterium]|nr:RIP metalloprotease RseP [Longimicrobiales bacterium]